MANINQNDIELELDGNFYIMRPSFQALCEIEQSVGKSLQILLNDFEVRGILLAEQVKIIYCGVKAGGNILNEAEIGEFICLYGINNSIKLVISFIRSALGEKIC